MEKYEYFIFLTICEVSSRSFSKTNFVTYTNYCDTMTKSLNDKTTNLSNREMSDVMSLVLELKLIYNMDTEMAVEYIMKYFNSDLCNDFRNHFNGLVKTFPFSFN